MLLSNSTLTIYILLHRAWLRREIWPCWGDFVTPDWGPRRGHRGVLLFRVCDEALCTLANWTGPLWSSGNKSQRKCWVANRKSQVKVSGLVGRNRHATATSLALVFTAPFLPGRTNCSISQLFLFLFYPGGGGPNYLELKVQNCWNIQGPLDSSYWLELAKE